MFRKYSKNKKEILWSISIFVSRIATSETQELIRFSHKEINQDIDKFPNYGDSEDRAMGKKYKLVKLYFISNCKYFNYKRSSKI